MAWCTASKATKVLNANKKMELTTKAEPIFGEFKGLGGFCVSSFSMLGGILLR
ncbi:MAG: hypothetical protein JRC91_04085 [Deltaproteobacteria bacterium]|nr:hypothetical protein [Deltaproteobacteria bacterium]